MAPGTVKVGYTAFGVPDSAFGAIEDEVE